MAVIYGTESHLCNLFKLFLTPSHPQHKTNSRFFWKLLTIYNLKYRLEYIKDNDGCKWWYEYEYEYEYIHIWILIEIRYNKQE